MINSNFLPPPAEAVDAVRALIALAADPKAASKRLDELLQAAQDHNATYERLLAKTNKMSAEAESHQRGLQEAHAKHDSEIAQERAAHNEAMATREAAVSRREAAVESAEAQVAAAKAENEKLGADLQRRLGLLKQAAG
jgi:hypothetical protein